MAIVLNCDMGEAYGLYRCGDDEGIMPLIHVANVACGFHAADPSVMRRTVRLAKQHGVKVGAHPAFPDLQGFGRREMKMGHDELVACIIYQVGALKAFLDAEGMALNHIKPHGALYGVASREPAVAEAIAEAVGVFGVPVMGMVGTVHETVYTGTGPRLHSRILYGPRLYRRGQADHYPRARRDRSGRGGEAGGARGAGGNGDLHHRQELPHDG